MQLYSTLGFFKNFDINIKQIPFLAPQYEVGGAYAIPLAIVDLNYLDAGSGVGF